MSRVTKAVEHLSIEEVKHRMQNDSRPFYRQRWLIIYNALVDPRPAEEIARHCGVGKFTVQKLISRYNRFGVAAVETKGKGGRKREYLTVEQERQFLEPFFIRATAGEIATAAEIHRAFEDCVAHKVDESTIYRLLQRHRWRKVAPRPRHPQAREEAQEAFKNRRCNGSVRAEVVHSQENGNFLGGGISMRKQKQPRVYVAVTKRTFRPEMRVCLTCQTPIRRSATLSQRTVITLDGPIEVIPRGYRCPNAACVTRQRSYRSAAADALALPGFTFGVDLVILVGHLRLYQHQTLDEVHQTLLKRLAPYALTISRREVLYLLTSTEIDKPARLEA
jgi:transposase